MDEIRLTHSAVPARPVRRRVALAALGSAALATSLALVPAAPASAGYLPLSTRMVSRDASGGVNGATSQATISGNGRFVAFVTAAPVVAADTNGKKDVYVRDRWAATTELVSMTDDEKAVAGDSTEPSISDDGRFVTFLSKAANLIPNDDKGLQDAFVRDRYLGTTTRVAPGLSGALLGRDIIQATISGDGRSVAFSTDANNVVANDTNNALDVFVRNLQSTSIERVSLSALDKQAATGSDRPSISDDGTKVAFASTALLASGVVGETNVYVRDRTAGTTELMNVKTDGSLPDLGGSAPYLSGDGKKVAFASQATNLVAGDTNGEYDTFVRDLVADTTVRVSLTDGDAQIPLGGSPTGIDRYGDRVLFFTRGAATPDDSGEDFDVYLRNVSGNSTRRITTGPAIPDPASAFTLSASTDDNGQDVAFSHAQKLTTDASFDQTYVNGYVWLGPFATTGEAIAQQYTDFLGRPATASEQSTWSAGFANETSSLPALQASLLSDPAFAGKRAPLARLYWAFFLRRPDPSGLGYWLGKYQAGASLTSIAQSFAKSSEFTAKYGTVTNAEYVKRVYQNVFERQPDASGLAYWSGKLDAKALTRGAVIVQFSESSEGKRRLAGPTNITLLSLAMLRRVPVASEWTKLYETVDAGEAQPAWIARTIMTLPGYEGRFD